MKQNLSFCHKCLCVQNKTHLENLCGTYTCRTIDKGISWSYAIIACLIGHETL